AAGQCARLPRCRRCMVRRRSSFLNVRSAARPAACRYLKNQDRRWIMAAAKTPSQRGVEFRIMPNGDGHWYWEVLTNANEVMARGVSDTEPEACQQASDAARRAHLITREGQFRG